MGRLWPSPVVQGLYKMTEVRYFSVHTEQTRSIKSLLYGIYIWEKQEMHDLKCIFEIHSGRRKQKIQILLIRKYLINN
jgi:hypothetical protein